jgi:uncharacterized protein
VAAILERTIFERSTRDLYLVTFSGATFSPPRRAHQPRANNITNAKDIMGITVTQINIFPVKGLGGISVKESLVTTRGLRFDRRFMVVDSDHEFVSQREFPRMATVWTDIVDGKLELAHSSRDPIAVDLEPSPLPTRSVRVWSSHVAAHTVSAEADAWLSEVLGFDARLVYMPDSAERRCNPEFAKNNEIVSFADGYPILITNESSLDDLNQRIASNNDHVTHIPMNRFRSNIVVKGADAWAEDAFTDFAIGSATFRVAKPCGRCQVTTTDQASGEVRGVEPLRTLSTFRESPFGVRFGMNLVPVTLGTLRVGDTLMLAS